LRAKNINEQALRICITDKTGIVCGVKMLKGFHCNGITVYLSAASADGLKFSRGGSTLLSALQAIN